MEINSQQLECIEVLEKWKYVKDNDWTMEKYRTSKTCSLEFLQIIDLPVLEKIISDLAKIYKRDYPYSTKPDFVNAIFNNTIHELERFNQSSLNYFAKETIGGCAFYYIYDREIDLPGCEPYQDYAIPFDREPDFFKQYFKKVLELLEKFEFENLNETSEDEPIQEAVDLKPKQLDISSFCYFMNKSEIKLKGALSDSNYCRSVCKEYNLKYTEFVRQNFKNDEIHKERIPNIKAIIFPKIPSDISKRLEEYLDCYQKNPV